MSAIGALRDVLVTMPDTTDAACARVDPELWFSDDPDEIDRAVGLCRECPVMAACLTGAMMREEKFGVWGGKDFTPASRRSCECGCGQPVTRNRAYASAECLPYPTHCKYLACGEELSLTDRRAGRRYCSPSCRSRAKHARAEGVPA